MTEHRQNSSVAVLGNITLDRLLWVPEIPLVDEVAVVEKVAECIGGRGAIVAACLSALGVEAHLCTCTGLLPNDLTAQFSQAGFQLGDTVTIDSSGQPIRIQVTIGRREQNCTSLLFASDINYGVTADHRLEVLRADVIYFTTHDLGFNLNFLSQKFAAGKHVIHNLSRSMWENEHYLRAIKPWCTTLIVNAFEFEGLRSHCGWRETNDVFQFFPNLQNIVVTRGADGADTWSLDGGRSHSSAISVPVVTPVGAGDAFSAGVVWALAKGWSIHKASGVGSAVAAASVRASTSCPNLSDLIAFVSSLVPEFSDGIG